MTLETRVDSLDDAVNKMLMVVIRLSNEISEFKNEVRRDSKQFKDEVRKDTKEFKNEIVFKDV